MDETARVQDLKAQACVFVNRSGHKSTLSNFRELVEVCSEIV